MNCNIIKNVSDPVTNQDVATKNYVDTHAFTTAGGVVSGYKKLSVGSDLVRSLGCNDLSAGKKFSLLLGTDTNMLTYTIPSSGLSVRIKIKTDVGFGILINELPIRVFTRDEILCSRPINMDQLSIKNVKNPVERFDAVNKAYVDKSFTDIIPNTVLTDHTLVSFPDAKGFLSKKTIIGKMWVERLSGDMISTSSPMFATEWPGFHKFVRGPSLKTFFSGSPASGWTRNFRLDCIELP